MFLFANAQTGAALGDEIDFVFQVRGLHVLRPGGQAVDRSADARHPQEFEEPGLAARHSGRSSSR